MVHEADIAAVALSALTRDGHGGKTYRLTGPEALIPAQRTRILAEAIGVPLTHRQLSEAQERTDRPATGSATNTSNSVSAWQPTHPTPRTRSSTPQRQ